MGDDPDRDAILKRRSRFIALALSGLTSAAGCDGRTAPGVCLEAPAIEQTGDEGEGTTPLPCLTPVTEPGPCLEAPIVDEPAPGPCLEAPLIEEPDEEPGAEGDLDPSAQPEPRPRPTPCLTPRRVVEPEGETRTEGARETRPQVCLSVLPDPDDEAER